jgi:hypothetical protein
MSQKGFTQIEASASVNKGTRLADIFRIDSNNII